MSRRIHQHLRTLGGTYCPLSIFVIFALFPFYWMFLASIKSNRELYSLKAFPFWVQKPVLSQYTYLFEDTDFLTWMYNSLLVGIITTCTSVIIGVLAGYGLARLRFRGAEGFGIAIFISYLVPTSLLFIPLSQVVNTLGVANSIWALLLTYPTFLVPFCTWLLMGYFKTIPRELEECAMIDGATRLGAFIKIVLPLAVPGIVCAALFSFTLSWNEFIYALTFISRTSQKTIPVGVVVELIRGDVYYWGSLMAGALLGSVPIAMIYSFFLDYYVSGLTAGAIK
ncbi:MAG: carbohydrate ABC transporter permease [Nitrospinota bacterium]|nr:MAG: carbohydrate ABC transporter permease [Nitrospinota bacterium]